jgi:outer membrane autotransporter protein
MKKLIVITGLICLSLSTTIKAQETPTFRIVELGVRYMPTFSVINLRTYNGQTVQGSASMSNGYGAMLAFNHTRYIGIQAEVNYYQFSQSYTDGNYNRQVDISYINVPLMLSLNTDKSRPVNLNIVLGPQFGFNVASNVKTSGSSSSDTLRAVASVKQVDVGFAYGAGLEFALNTNHTFRLDLGYRGFYGMVDINSGNTENGTYNVVVKTSRKINGAYVGLALTF